jgi:hypothetical protein
MSFSYPEAVVSYVGIFILTFFCSYLSNIAGFSSTISVGIRKGVFDVRKLAAISIRKIKTATSPFIHRYARLTIACVSLSRKASCVYEYKSIDLLHR